MRVVLVCLSLGALSLLFLPGAPGYDAWAWLTWGREIGRLELSTVDGPAWKPLPVAVTTLLAPLGGAAPEAWLVVARAGAAAAVVLAFVCARRLGGTVAGVLAAGAVLATGGFVRHASVGDAEPLLVALVLAAFWRALAGSHRQALAFGALAALVRPEVWPFLGVYALWRWRDDAGVRPALAGLALAVPALWFVPEWLGSGELLRSTDRARVPNPGQPATAERPALETLAGAAAVVFVPAALAALAARGAAALLAVGGAAWIVLVAAMSEAGFSGEARYVLPGAAVLAVGGAAGAARVLDARPRAVAALVVAVFAVAAIPRAADVADLRPRLRYQGGLASDLARAVAAAGGRDRVLACGRPAVGRYRGTLLAWHLDVPKHAVRADGLPGDVTFVSRLTGRSPSAPPAPSRSEPLAAAGRWKVVAMRRCVGTSSGRAVYR